jgi:myo-inositol 2-dehydrogenase/D-chiro-inositol 1-dehydrogenase
LEIDQFSKALEDPKVHAIFISTTSHTHFDLIVASAKAKKHVFVEKPLALSAEDTKLCLDAATEAGVTIYCGFQRRSDPEFVKMKQELVHSGGKVELVRISSRDGASLSPISYLLSSGGKMEMIFVIFRLFLRFSDT